MLDNPYNALFGDFLKKNQLVEEGLWVHLI
jgi:hypothetical protein